MNDKMKITVLSLACCNPAFAVHDQQYISRIKEALQRINIEAQVELVAASDAFFGLKVGYIRKLWPLFNKYGMAVAPALFINGELTLYGGVPSLEKIIEVIEKERQKTGKPEANVGN